MATYNNIKKIKIGDNIFNLYDSGNSGGTITSVKTTAGTHTAINVTSGAANFNVPTKTSHLTNDSGFITGITKAMVTTALGTGSGTTKFLREDGSWATPADTQVTSTAVTAATTLYLTGSTSTTTTGTLNKHASARISVSDSSTNNGYTRLILGNSTSNGAVGGKSGSIQLYSVTSYYSTIHSDVLQSNCDITLPSSAGTLALTSDIPTSAAEIDAVPTTRTVNGYALSSDISLTASDVGAAASSDIPTVSTITVNTTTSKGTYVGSSCHKYGRVVTLTFRFRNTSSIASGADLYTGTLSSTLPLPYDTVSSVTYYGAHALVGVLLTDRSLTIRNASNSAVQFGPSNTASMSFTYVCQ